MKTPSETSRADYEAMGFACGLEVHHQLDCRHKLFCHCPNTDYSPLYDTQLLRRLRPTHSEVGEYDPTAVMEFKTRKEIVYRIARGTACTYEMDERPPFLINGEALDVALQVAMLLRCTLVDELHVSRKQYLDGSIPAGFQRTALLGVGGTISCCGRDASIRHVCIEEDACREVSDVGHRRTFLTDRLSIPLVEVTTAADLRTPADAFEMAKAVRTLLHSTGGVRTGSGSNRQDVNVSIAGGSRVEIKGVNRVKLVPVLAHYEAMRQAALLDLAGRLRDRGLSPADIGSEAADVTEIVERSTQGPIRAAVDMGQRVLAVRLPWFRGLMRHPTGPSAAFDSELQGRIRVIACLDRFPNLLHDDAADSALGVAEWEAIRRELAAGGQDVALLVWGPPEDARTAAAEVLVRCREALVGVPAETRRALPDGSTTFERILSLRSSMCEDTDHPPLPITRERIASLAERLAAPPAESQSAFEAAGLPRDIARTMASDPRKRVFEKLLALPGAAPMRAWRLVGQAMRSLRRRGVPVDRIPDERIEDLFGYWNRGAFASAALPDLIVELATHPERPVADVVARMAPPPASEALAATVRRALTGTDWRRPGRPNKEFLLAMRIAMRTLGKSVSGAQVAAVVTSLLGQEDAL